MIPEVKVLFHGVSAGCSFIGLTLGLVKVDVIATVVFLAIATVCILVPELYKKGKK